MQSVQSVLIYVLLFMSSKVMNDQFTLVKINNILCRADEKLMKDFTCKLKPINRNVTLINAGGVLTKEMSDIRGHLQIFVKNSVRYIPFLINHTQNVCDFYNGKPTFFYASYGLRFLAKYCNINHTCPYSGKLFCKNMLFSMADIPLGFPHGNYRTVVTFYETTKQIFEMMVHSTLYGKSPKEIKIGK